MLFYYILGVCISGLLFLLLTNISSFYEFLFNNVENAKKELKNDDRYGIVESTLLDSVDNDKVINSLHIVTAILSWIGILLIIIYLVEYTQYLINNKKQKPKNKKHKKQK